MRVIGLTGGMGSGKSTAAAWFSTLGLPVLDADQVARQVVEPGSPALAEIARRFGSAVLQPDGRLDRGALGERVRQDVEARRALEAITHPRIQQAMTHRLEQFRALGHEVAVVEAALMVETGSFQRYDAIVLIDASEPTRVERIARRQGIEREKAAQWVATQLSREARRGILEQAFEQGGPPVFVVSNEGDEASLQEGLRRAWSQLSRLWSLRT